MPEETSDILTQGMVAHVGFIQDEQPFVIPMSYYYDPQQPEYLYLHGSVRSRTLKHLAGGAPVCVTVTLTDGLVYSRKAMNHSMNYRSGGADAEFLLQGFHQVGQLQNAHTLDYFQDLLFSGHGSSL